MAHHVVDYATLKAETTPHGGTTPPERGSFPGRYQASSAFTPVEMGGERYFRKDDLPEGTVDGAQGRSI